MKGEVRYWGRPFGMRRFFRSDRAAVTAEFVIGFPVLFLMFLVTIELTFLMVRSTLLQQALEVTMRDVRLGNIVNPTVIELEEEVCSKISVPDCDSSMVLEFTRIDQATFAMPASQAPCTRRSPEIMQARASEVYFTGAQNELMVVRACLVVDTVTPMMGDAFEIFARTAFVNEPQD
jgi:hypothetical protein